MSPQVSVHFHKLLWTWCLFSAIEHNQDTREPAGHFKACTDVLAFPFWTWGSMLLLTTSNDFVGLVRGEQKETMVFPGRSFKSQDSFQHCNCLVKVIMKVWSWVLCPPLVHMVQLSENTLILSPQDLQLFLYRRSWPMPFYARFSCCCKVWQTQQRRGRVLGSQITGKYPSVSRRTRNSV